MCQEGCAHLNILRAIAIGLCDMDVQAALLSLDDIAICPVAAPGVHLQAQQTNALPSSELCGIYQWSLQGVSRVIAQ